MTSLHGTTDSATMTLAFPSMPTMHQGPQTLKTLLLLQQHMMNCAETFLVDGRPRGYLSLDVGAALYALCTADPYPARTVDPGPRVIYTVAAGQLAQKNQEANFGIVYRAHHNEKNMDQALIQRFFLCLGPDKAQDLRDRIIAIINPSFLQIRDEAVAMWGHTTPSSRSANLKTLEGPWHATEGMAKLWRNIQDTVSFAVAAQAPVPLQQITDAALLCINRTQCYKTAYLAYRQLAVQNYQVLKAHFEQAERDRAEVEDEAGAHGYGMHATEAADRALQQSVAEAAAALTSIAAGETANGTINENDASLQATVAALQRNQAIMQQTIVSQQAQLAANATQPTGPPPTMMAPPPMMPMMPYCAPAMQQAPLQPIQFNGQQNNRGRGGNNKNPIKRYENLNYCHSCGFNIPAAHSSATCPKQKQGHQFQATRQNTMGGSMAGSHKTVMPSAGGKLCEDVKAVQRGQQKQQNGYQQNGYQQNGYQQNGNGYQQQNGGYQ